MISEKIENLNEIKKYKFTHQRIMICWYVKQCRNVWCWSVDLRWIVTMFYPLITIALQHLRIYCLILLM